MLATTADPSPRWVGGGWPLPTATMRFIQPYFLELLSNLGFLGNYHCVGSRRSPLFSFSVTLVPAVETREVTRIPCLAESRRAQIPVWADFARHGTQIMPKIDDRGTAPEPVAVIDAVNHEAGLEHERMRDHRIILGVGVLLDVEILLNGSVRVRKECPLGSD